MIYIQPLRKNDINPNGGKQVEFGKKFFEQFGWNAGNTYNVIFHANGIDISTSFKVRDGDRAGADCKEYANSEGKFPLKDFFIYTKKFSVSDVGTLFYIIEPLDMKGEEFNLYFVSSKYITDEEFEEVGGANHISLTSLQQIYYGAPGTGKSHSINEQTEGESVIRTTFHPDSDYSTFVGAYKPTTKEVELRDVTGHKVMENGKVVTEDRIVYEFVDQAFLQAYVNAWKFYAENEEEPKKQFLVIEEINRGNCAQIFGDLFQLLDRNEWGFSDYPINADKDMKKQLKKALAGLSIADAETINGLYKGRDVVKEVLEGDILLLPNNLYIWATMNTSDQSLFPIDSAFKRRWDWQYMPIAQGRDEAGRELVWTIDVNGIKYSWWSFLEKINAQIGEATQSEDKKLGFFFCKAKDGVITPETFVGKVVFYLWNDVFKDYGFEGSIFKDKDGTELSFNKFYAADLKGNAVVQKDKVELFLNNLGVEIASSEDETDGNDKVGMTITYNGEAIREKNDLETYVKAIEKIGVERIAPLNITCYGQQVVGTEPPANYAWRTVNDYKILTFKLHRHMERILSEIATGLQEDIKVTFE